MGNETGRRVFRCRFLPILLVLSGLIVYLNSFAGVFIFDDTVHILESERIRHLWPPWDLLARRRPTLELSLAVNYAIGGLGVWGYHAFNLAVHVLAGLTLFGIARRTLMHERCRDRLGQASHWLALTIALIWLVHPLQTQSVTYIIQRSESLMGLFYLLTLYCVIRGAESPLRYRWYLAAVIACALGMGSKAVMVTAPLVVLLYDRVFLSPSFSEAFRKRWGLYSGLAANWGILAACGVVQG
ncbi:MAG: glycosyltransferase family 39 protein, partial [Phycisphaerae bacterium]